MKELLFNLFSGAIENVGESKLEEALQKLQEKNPAMYEAAIKGGHALCKALLPIVTETKSKIDDVVLSAIADAIKDSAAANSISLD